jgi:hypothetical protein
MDKVRRVGNIHTIKISDVDVGDRARDEMGDIDSVQASRR